MKKVLKWFAVAVAIIFVGIQFVRPERINPPVVAAHALESHVSVPPEVKGVLTRACSDCHSNETRWPWYSNVAPASWFLADHVEEGRDNMNFSTWSSYQRRQAEGLLDQVCKEVQHGAMPLRSYTLLHPDAKLSEADVKTLCDWANSERTRLASQTPPRSP